MSSVAVNTELHERFEKHLVGLLSQMDFTKFRKKLAGFNHNFVTDIFGIFNLSRVTSTKCKRTSGQWRNRLEKCRVAVKRTGRI